MSWNTRIIRHHVIYEEEGNTVYDYYFTINEVYYDENGKIVGWSVEPIDVYFEDKKWLKTVIKQIKDAEKRTVLDMEEVGGESSKLVETGKKLNYFKKKVKK